jgi:hypothetical protein
MTERNSPERQRYNAGRENKEIRKRKEKQETKGIN